jgi:acyl-coenzyme A synthetase/AMP-(fatty) acid ligase
MSPPEQSSLRRILQASPRLAARRLWGGDERLPLAEIAGGSCLGGHLQQLAGRSVLLRTGDPLFAALALIELDGVARRIVLCPPDLADADLPLAAETAGIDAVVFDGALPPLRLTDALFVAMHLPPAPLTAAPRAELATEWVMFTSGTSGVPKMVIHGLRGLTGAIKPADPDDPPPVWGTFYDIRRYGGLQILLRALLGEGSMVLARPGEPVADLLARLGRHGVTHLTGTPSHWRRVLMSPAARLIAPKYIRLSGEIADQAVLDSLKGRFPGVPFSHAYASTEAGVGFEVNDGLEGFPAAFLERRGGEVEMRVMDGALQLRSARTASAYVGGGAGPLIGDDGFVDTGDMVERRGDRYHFVGRRNGVINVGGLKVHPEEIEAVINRHPAVRMSLVRGRRNPITGAIVVAEVVLNQPCDAEAAVKDEIIAACRRHLAPFKIPTSIRMAPALAMTAGGKLERAVA